VIATHANYTLPLSLFGFVKEEHKLMFTMPKEEYEGRRRNKKRASLKENIRCRKKPNKRKFFF
jgi:hypothetical protein